MACREHVRSWAWGSWPVSCVPSPSWQHTAQPPDGKCSLTSRIADDVTGTRASLCPGSSSSLTQASAFVLCFVRGLSWEVSGSIFCSFVPVTTEGTPQVSGGGVEGCSVSCDTQDGPTWEKQPHPGASSPSGKTCICLRALLLAVPLAVSCHTSACAQCPPGGQSPARLPGLLSCCLQPRPLSAPRSGSSPASACHCWRRSVYVVTSFFL